MFGMGQRVLGLDIGSSTIKLADLNVGRNSAQLNYFGFLPMPVSQNGSGEITNPLLVADAIRSLIAQSKIRNKAVAAGLWGTSVIVKKISMPRVEKKILNQQIRWEAEQYIPFDPSEISLTYQILPTLSDPDSMDILLVAAQNAIVRSYKEVVSKSGLNLSVLDVNGFALGNLFLYNYGKISGQTVGLINVGAVATNFIVIHDGVTLFSRDIPMGGFQYSNDISRELGLTLPEAEALKLSATTGQEVPQQVHSVMSTVTDQLVEEFRNSFDFFSASNGGMSLSKVYFTGGSSLVSGLMAKASQVIGIQFEQMNPFLKVKPSGGMSQQFLHQISPFSTIAMGLALRSGNES